MGGHSGVLQGERVVEEIYHHELQNYIGGSDRFLRAQKLSECLLLRILSAVFVRLGKCYPNSMCIPQDGHKQDQSDMCTYTRKTTCLRPNWQ